MKKTLTGLLKRIQIRVTLKHYGMLKDESEKKKVSMGVIIDKALKYYWSKI